MVRYQHVVCLLDPLFPSSKITRSSLKPILTSVEWEVSIHITYKFNKWKQADITTTDYTDSVYWSAAGHHDSCRKLTGEKGTATMLKLRTL